MNSPLNGASGGNNTHEDSIKSSATKENKRRLLIQELKRNQLIERRSREIRNIINYIHNPLIPHRILKKLKDELGSTRLLIVSENNNDVLINHGFNDGEVEALKKISSNAPCITVEIFNKPRQYRIIMDHRTTESPDGFEGYWLNSIIYPLIHSFIKENEQLFFRNTFSVAYRLEKMEGLAKIPSERNDYHTLVTRIVGKCTDPLEFHQLREKETYINNFLKALDICRGITRGSDNLPKEINDILGGKMERDILDMVKSMLLSRNETMNGSGYPFGLNKREIPLEGRIYKIIRAYEALSSTKETGAIKNMAEWAYGGYFDNEILQVFFENFPEEEGFSKLPYHRSTSAMSAEDQKNQKTRESRYYTPFIQSTTKILEIIKEIGDIYHDSRMAEGDTRQQIDLFRRADKLQPELLTIADISVRLLLIRHGATESDTTGLIPGNPDELLTKEGERDSLKKGVLLQNEPLRIVSGPLPRTQQTAEIIRKAIRDCRQNTPPTYDSDSSLYTLPPIESYPTVILEESLTNPLKYLENGRGSSLLQRFLSDSMNGTMKGLGEFTKKLISSLGMETILVITHGDTAVYLMILLENNGSQDQIFGKKIPIKNDRVYEFLIRGGRLLSEEEQKTKGLLFSTTNQNTLISELNILTKKVFGEIFYDPKNGYAGSKSLHNQFLDFMDIQREGSPKKLALFINELKANPLTSHFPLLLRTEGLIK